MNPIVFRFIMIGVWILTNAHLSSGQRPPSDQPPSDGIARNRAIEVIIPAENGVVRWADVASSLGRSLKLDPVSVEQLLPTGQLDLRSETVMLVLLGINLTAGDAFSLDTCRNGSGQECLRVRCDRGLFGSAPKPVREVTIDLDTDWPIRSETNPMVVFLPGLHGDAEAFTEFREFVRASGFATAAVSYDYDQPIAESAKRVAQLVSIKFAAQQRRPDFVLIGHSMGGLVARCWAEDPNLRQSSIKRLITIGTPHRGSNWASLPPLLDLFAGQKFDTGDFLDVLLHQPSSAGLRDLEPESEFIQSLCAKQPRDDVHYTCIVGLGSPVDAEQVAQIQQTLRSLDQDGSLVRLVRPRIQPLLGSFDEMARGKGDGVVASSHAIIHGVQDCVEVDVSHFDMIRPFSGTKTNPVWEIVQDRLHDSRNQ